MHFKHNLHQLLVSLDQFLNCLVGIFLYKEQIWADMTFSATCYIWHRDGKRSWPYKVVNTIFFWQKDHCLESYQSEEQRSQLPPELR